MPAANHEKFTHGANFHVEIDGIELPVVEYTAPAFEINKIEYKIQNTGTKQFEVNYLPGTPKYGEVTFTYVFRKDALKLVQWFALAYKGKVPAAYKNISIVVKDPSNTAEFERYNFHKALPTKLDFGTLKAGDTNALQLKITVQYHGLEETVAKLAALAFGK